MGLDSCFRLTLMILMVGKYSYSFNLSVIRDNLSFSYAYLLFYPTQLLFLFIVKHHF